MVWRCVAYNTWVRSSKANVTLKGQLKTIVLCICLFLSRSNFAHSVKDYKIIWYKCLCVAHNTYVRTSKVTVTLRGQLKIPVRSVTSTNIVVYLYKCAQIFFKGKRWVAHIIWVCRSKVKVTLRGRLKIPVRSVTATDIEVYYYNFAQMFVYGEAMCRI